MTHIRMTTTQRGYAKMAADVGAITDSAGGTPSRTFGVAGALYSQSDENNTRSSIADAANDLRDNLRTSGQMA